MQNLKQFALVAALLLFLCPALSACGGASNNAEEDLYPVQYLQDGETIESLFDLVGEKSSAAMTTNDTYRMYLIFTQCTADGGVVAWYGNSYVYIPDSTNEGSARLHLFLKISNP